MTLNVSRFKPWLVLLFCCSTFAVSSAWAQRVTSSWGGPGDAELFAELTTDALSGDAEAQNDLGKMYDWGRFVPEDDSIAVMWFTKAAEQGHLSSMFTLGMMYEHARGVPGDGAAAVMWYTKGAELGDDVLQIMLGNIYYKGEAVPKDDVIAYMWFNLATAQGSESAMSKKIILEEEMTAADVSKAQALSSECFVQNYQNCGY